MKRSLLTSPLTVATMGVALGGACLTTGNCQSQMAPASSSIESTPVVLAKKSTTKTAPKQIRWFTSLQAAQKESKRTGKPIFADFYADWCPPCQMLKKQTYPNPKVIAESQKWVMLRIDTEKNTTLAVKYGIFSLPTLAVMRADGKPVTGTTGFLNAGEFIKFLRDVRKEVTNKKA